MLISLWINVDLVKHVDKNMLALNFEGIAISAIYISYIVRQGC